MDIHVALPASARNSPGHKAVRRVSAACDECRSRKIRCDGRRPVCSPCSRRTSNVDLSCTWGTRKKRGAGVSQAEFKSLKRRLHEVETAQTRRGGEDRTPEHSSDAQAPAVLATPGSTGRAADESTTMIGTLGDESATRPHASEDSSAKSFVDRIKGFLGYDGDQRQHPPSTTGTARAPAAHPRAGSLPALDYALPSRQRADYLLACYWQRTIYPFVERDELDGLYLKLWAGDELGEDWRPFLCLLNMIFSMACISMSNIAASERVQNAELYYQRAREFVDLDFLTVHSTLTVRSFLLMGEYLQSKNDSQGCWTFIGLSIRIAQSLGLDAPGTSANASSTCERESMRRLWHSCVLMDRALAMTTGRPAMITAQAAASVPYPSPHPGSSACSCIDSGAVPATSETNYHFFIEALKLYEVMNEILLKLYNTTSGEFCNDVYLPYFGNEGAKAAGAVMEIHAQLEALLEELPRYLQHKQHPSKPSKYQRETNILWLRHRHVRLLLLRPVLAKFCDPKAPPPTSELRPSFPWKIALAYSVQCTETALETIHFTNHIVFKQHLDKLDDLLPGWWYSILYIYSAAAVLIAASLQPSILEEISEKAVVDGWRLVMQILGHFASVHKHAAICAVSLNRLYKEVRLHHSDIQKIVNTQSQDHAPGPAPHPTEPVGSERQPPSLTTASGGSPSSGNIYMDMEPSSTAMLPQAWLNHEGNESGHPIVDSDILYSSTEAADMFSDYHFDEHLNDLLDPPVGFDDMSWLTFPPFQRHNLGSFLNI